jgi:hypothetical protein
MGKKVHPSDINDFLKEDEMYPKSLLFKLEDAFNLHDIDSFCDCFHEDY